MPAGLSPVISASWRSSIKITTPGSNIKREPTRRINLKDEHAQQHNRFDTCHRIGGVGTRGRARLGHL
jgi:hypothetical protein